MVPYTGAQRDGKKDSILQTVVRVSDKYLFSYIYLFFFYIFLTVLNSYILYYNLESSFSLFCLLLLIECSFFATDKTKSCQMLLRGSTGTGTCLQK